MQKLTTLLSVTLQAVAASALFVVVGVQPTAAVTGDTARGNTFERAQRRCTPDSAGSYGTWSYLMYRGGPTHTLEIEKDGNNVVLINSFSDGSGFRRTLTQRAGTGDCAWSDPASEETDEWYEITAEGLKMNDRDGFIRLAPPMGLIQFGGHLPKGEYDVDHGGHEGQVGAAELHG